MGGNRMTINDAFFIERQGKRMVLYAGLLQEAHENHGLHSIDTILLQAPTEANGNVAIARALVTLDTNADPEERRKFAGIGDASPDNVGRNIVPHLIRMAETRAKARALRDAINVGVTAFEELGGEEEPRRQEEPERTLGGATRKAAGKLWMLAGGKDVQAVQAFEANAGKEIKDMNAKEVSEWIGRLS
jgi:hypothetical protein